jgi:hypothetical protein
MFTRTGVPRFSSILPSQPGPAPPGASHGLRPVGAHRPGDTAGEEADDQPGRGDAAEDTARAGQRDGAVGRDAAAVDGENGLAGVDEPAEAADLVAGQHEQDAEGWRLWIEAWAGALRDPVLRETAGGLDQQWKAALADVIAEGAAAGEFTCEGAAAAAWRLTAFLDGLAVQMSSYDASLSRTTMLEWIDAALAGELGLDRAALTGAEAR